MNTAFCEYWTSIKIKFSMSCVSKEYETKTKTKMVHQQWLKLKTLFKLGYNLETVNLKIVKLWKLPPPPLHK